MARTLSENLPTEEITSRLKLGFGLGLGLLLGMGGGQFSYRTIVLEPTRTHPTIIIQLRKILSAENIILKKYKY